jgi:hypothetical protein
MDISFDINTDDQLHTRGFVAVLLSIRAASLKKRCVAVARDIPDCWKFDRCLDSEA